MTVTLIGLLKLSQCQIFIMYKTQIESLQLNDDRTVLLASWLVGTIVYTMASEATLKQHNYSIVS